MTVQYMMVLGNITLLQSTILKIFLKCLVLHISWSPSHFKNQCFFPTKTLNGLTQNRSRYLDSQVALNLQIQASHTCLVY